ncbi:amidase [Planococcus shenhongbingii]|uniref:Amidase n=1 Tax=Planococcus shenhongbingii TaxID=3058398 RepID=A0ABT8NES2_9BACL|nr:amidase [Planococcus sp. N017]MDN7246172.1 amidase [Planococcus sp. N017]
MPINNIKDLLFESIEEIGLLYRKKEVSPVEVTEATLERLHALEPKLNAFITVLADQAMGQAKAAEAVFVNGGEAGRLTGIPVSLKDIFMTKGIRTTVGSRILKDYVPDEDAFVYKALQEAGAVIIGKNNMLEFAYGSVHPDYGQCNNPWDVNRTAGGSSTGSASSVGAGIGFASIGTDTGGSIRVPASFCGIVGLKPTYGTVPSQGLFPLSQSLDHIGPLTRTVRDNAAVLETISSKAFDFNSAFSGGIKGLKVGVIQALMDTVTNPEVLSLIAKAIERLRDLGADIQEADIPGIEKIESAALVIVLAEASAVHKEWYDTREADYNPATYANLKAGFGISAVTYLETLEKQKQFKGMVDEALKEVDILVCPTMAYPATEKDPSFENGDIDVSRRTIPFNFSGHPALSVPAGNTISENLPVGLQIIGRYHNEATVYKVADAFQQATGGYKLPPI